MSCLVSDCVCACVRVFFLCVWGGDGGEQCTHSPEHVIQQQADQQCTRHSEATNTNLHSVKEHTKTAGLSDAGMRAPCLSWLPAQENLPCVHARARACVYIYICVCVCVCVCV